MAKAPRNIRSIARAHTETAIRVLASIMSDPSAPPGVRSAAATELLNRGLGRLEYKDKFVLDRREYYVYSIQSKSNELIYVGKGRGRRSVQSASRLSGKPRIRAVFTSEKQALAFERRLIERFRPVHNVIYNGQYNQGLDS